jgi:hypothetical protein
MCEVNDFAEPVRARVCLLQVASRDQRQSRRETLAGIRLVICASSSMISSPERSLRPHIDGPLAQLVEQRTFNPLVIGSNPIRPTKTSSRSV